MSSEAFFGRKLQQGLENADLSVPRIELLTCTTSIYSVYMYEYVYIYIYANILYTERDGDSGGHSVRDRDSDSVLNRYHKFYLSKPEYIYSMKTGWNASNSSCQSWLQCCSIQFQDFCLTHPF